MAHSVKWLYPSNWDGNPPEKGGWRRIMLQLTGNADVYTEDYTNKQVLDISELRTSVGDIPVKTIIEKIDYSVKGDRPYKLSWDRSPNVVIAELNGEGKLDYCKHGGNVDPGESGDGTGDILLTTVMGGSGAYSIVITARLR